MNEKIERDTANLNPGAAAFLKWMDLRLSGVPKGRAVKNGNPYSCPRPRPFVIAEYFEGSPFDWCCEPRNLRMQLEDNMDWLCHSWRTTGEIYSAMFRLVDPEEIHHREGIDYIRESLWDLGFRSVGAGASAWDEFWILPSEGN